MKVVTPKAEARNSRPYAGLVDDRNIPLAVGAKILGVSPDSIRKRQAPRGVESLTIIDSSRSGAQRRLLQLRLSEVIALRDKLYEDARARLNVERLIEKKHLQLVVNE